ncbi:hypothetical protein [Metabacillus halosaccharovorans]|uniref:Uncharacterized protein n=1 Tax=Metabacillus halosaccharovorans TaxID=930124 RepID=A0ABT3DBC3_9BACI|nr:hypothetical protein [Metabacillus halosaccharovorans]MCV9884347.1 hypothetical protein [Metabacillus halosaccharovorans]
MKIDSKMRRIQQKYKIKIEAKNKKGKDALVVASIILFIILLLFFEVKFPYFEEDAIKPVATDDYQKKWMDVTQEIDDTLKDNSEYTGIAIDFSPEPIKLILKTSFEKTNVMGNDHLNELISIANESITSNNLPASLKENETYKIIVTGKNKEEIARGTFRNDE